jgi:hypothetical protein
MKNFFLLFVFLAASVNAPAFAAEPVGYVGLWHHMPVLGSMWSDRLLLEEGGTFIYAQSLMDGETRERFIGGTYSVSPDGELTLSREVTISWEGGESVPATGSIGTKTEIAGYRVSETRSEPPREIVTRVEKPVYDEEYPHPWSVVFSGGDFIDKGRWWKYETEEDLSDLREEYAAALRQAASGGGR